MPNANIGFNTSQNKAVIKARTPYHCSSKIKKIPMAISMEALLLASGLSFLER